MFTRPDKKRYSLCLGAFWRAEECWWSW